MTAVPATAPSGVSANGRAPRVALVVGSGSVKCAAAIGLWRVLKREGIQVELLVGCSAGSIYTAALALGDDPDTVAEKSRRLWTREVTERANWPAIARAIFPRLLGFDEQFGLRDDRLVVRRLREAFGDATFADLRIPLAITATDFRTGEQVVLTTGTLVDAIRASIALPFAFAPWRIGDRLLVDGMVSDPLPVGVAVREGAAIIIAMGFESPYQRRVRSPSRFAFQLSSMMTNNLLRASFAFHGLAHHGEVIPIIPRFAERVRLFETSKLPYVVAEGERAMEEQLPYLRRLLSAVPA